MANDTAAQQTAPGEPFVWVRCPCGNGLWRRYADRLEMTISPRGGQKRVIRRLNGPDGTVSMVDLHVQCEKCGQVWTAS